MKHTMLDCYGSIESKLDDVKYINNLLNHVAYQLNLVSVAPPFLLPYYYGVEPEDIGISAFLFLKGGHITIHTFPLRECYFVDMVYDGEYDENVAYKLFKRLLPFEDERSIINTKERKINEEYILPISSEEDFGPHILAKIDANVVPTMETIFDFLESTIDKIGMTPIIRPYVIKDLMVNPTYLSGIVMIAESHISFHYNYNEKVIYFDLFSCKMFDHSKIKDILIREFGNVSSYVVIPRGTKHKYNKVSNMIQTEKIYNSVWKDNICKK